MCTSDSVVDRSTGEKQDRIANIVSKLLELAAADDLEGFRAVVEQEGHEVVDEPGLWYGRLTGSKKMRLEDRTSLMIAAMFGSKRVLNYILGLNCVDVNKVCGSDRATAVHLAVAGGCGSSIEVVRLLIDAGADVNCLDVHGDRPVDLVPFIFGSSFNSRRKILELMLNGCSDDEELRVLTGLTVEQIDDQKEQPISVFSPVASGTEKKEYPIDLSLPDMKNGIYSTDEFRMYTFKIKPCSRAYSHDWTECPFVHPGENARRRDPRKYSYSCVPCPEFRKGSCRNGDACEYAHGIFECWLHPAQYRTRLCKDEVGCNRKVCFFAHKPEELRPLHPSTGSAVLSPRSLSLNLSDISSISPFSLGSPTTTPSGASSPRGGPMWANQSPPNLKVHTSRFKTTPNARDSDLEPEFMRVDRYHQHQIIDDFSDLSSPTRVNRNSLELLASMDPTILAQLQGLSLDAKMAQLHHNMNYSSGFPSSPLQMSLSSSSGADRIMNSRSAAFAKRSQSFIDRGTVNHQSGFTSLVSSSAATMTPSKLSDWGSPDGKLNWGIQKDELNKLRKSASFGVRTSGLSYGAQEPLPLSNIQDPASPWSPVKDSQRGKSIFDEDQHFSPWMEQPYVEQEQLVA